MLPQRHPLGVWGAGQPNSQNPKPAPLSPLPSLFLYRERQVLSFQNSGQQLRSRQTLSRHTPSQCVQTLTRGHRFPVLTLAQAPFFASSLVFLFSLSSSSLCGNSSR